MHMASEITILKGVKVVPQFPHHTLRGPVGVHIIRVTFDVWMFGVKVNPLIEQQLQSSRLLQHLSYDQGVL